MELPKRYDAHTEEPLIQEFWRKEKVFAFKKTAGPLYTIDTPPPTLSGRMHIGHAFSYAQGDFIARYRRMRGDAVFYPFGTDDNGLPTERLVERQEGISAKRMDKSEFRARVLEAVKRQLPEFSSDWIRLGVSADFDNSYSTIDDHSRKTSQLSFIDLHKKGLVYRKETPVTWCVQCQTAIAQAEFDNIEKDSSMNTIAFKGPGGEELLIMTTRPELVPACVALAAHPADKRYKALKGKEVLVPLSGHKVPVIFDEKADPQRGTGLMMVCTFGDKEDVEKWHVHKLDTKIIFTPDGKVKAGVIGEGLRIVEARKAALKALDEQGLLKGQEPVRHAVNVHERCGTEIEFLPSEQWYVNVLDHKEELIKVGDNIKWYPDFMRSRYTHWVENLNWDWCISRQRPYGVPFPVWYDQQGTVVLPEEDELPVDPSEQVPRAWKGREGELTADPDVMDTWATSSTTPQIALDWAKDPEAFAKSFPMSLRLQAHDIIRTWAFYTIVKAHYHHGQRPWDDIVISGHALDPKGKKMSKSKGNIVDPNEVMDKYCADALRFWAASTKLGEDLPYQEKDIVTGQKTITKLWNASRFSFMHLESYDGNVPEHELELIDRWVLARFDAVLQKATSAFERYEYSRTKAEAENFFWNVFAADYLELVKDRLYNEDRSAEEKHSAQFTLYTVLLGQLKLFAPIMPHITERIFGLFYSEREGENSIHNSRWPAPRKELYDAESLAAGDLLAAFLAEVRRHKSERQISMRADIEHAVIAVPPALRKHVEAGLIDFQATARILDISFDDDSDEPSIRIE
jgi:valyl-tRNA synthetase